LSPCAVRRRHREPRLPRDLERFSHAGRDPRGQARMVGMGSQRRAAQCRIIDGMSIAPYIKEIGRGKEGARALTQVQAYDLMSQVLDGRVTDLEIGAFAIAMRIKGETTEELAGFLEAVQERCVPLRPVQPMVVLPSYNGARKLPNLTALLALLLAQDGIPVLVHGPS